MSKKEKVRNTQCRVCDGDDGRYRYSYELTVFLGLRSNEGVYICDECMLQLNEDYNDTK